MLRNFLLAAIILFKTSSARIGDSKHYGIQRFDFNHIRMGEISNHCDTGKWRLGVDWNGSPLNYTCFSPKEPIMPRPTVPNQAHCTELRNYSPKHFCMTDYITYNETIPTFGDHRPLWPKYGEYKFLPPQRWLHSVEHGAVVMLYHPCAHPRMVHELRTLVQNCIRKHIITPSNLLPRDTPLILVTWGCKLSMTHVNHNEVIKFIKTTALKAPAEGKLAKDGQYSMLLLRPAAIVSDYNDSKLCPFAR